MLHRHVKFGSRANGERRNYRVASTNDIEHFFSFRANMERRMASLNKGHPFFRSRNEDRLDVEARQDQLASQFSFLIGIRPYTRYGLRFL